MTKDNAYQISLVIKTRLEKSVIDSFLDNGFSFELSVENAVAYLDLPDEETLKDLAATNIFGFPFIIACLDGTVRFRSRIFINESGVWEFSIFGERIPPKYKVNSAPLRPDWVIEAEDSYRKFSIFVSEGVEVPVFVEPKFNYDTYYDL